jgi:predicted dehydrogenase
MKDGLLTVAIVGYGYWGPNLLRNYMELPHASVKWVCDREPMKLAKAKTRYPSVLVTESYGDVLGDPDVDAVVIATPISTHFPLADAALSASKHVFVEKPLTSSSLDAQRLILHAESRKLTLMVGHTFEFSPPVVKIKEIIDSGELGDVYFVSSSRVNLGLHQKDVSVIWDLAPHDFSILFDWLGEEPEHVSAMGRGCVKCDIPDVAFVNLRFPSGAVAEVQLSWLSPVKLRRTIVVGSKKMLVYDDTETVEKVKLYDHGVNFVEPGSFGEFQLSYRTGDIVSPHLETYEPLYTEAAHFVTCVLDGTVPKTDGQSGLRVVRTLERAEASMIAHGKSVPWQDGPVVLDRGQLALSSLLLDEMAGEPAA